MQIEEDTRQRGTGPDSTGLDVVRTGVTIILRAGHKAQIELIFASEGSRPLF